MKLLGSTKSYITKDENSKNVLRLEITEVVLVRYDITIINKIQEPWIYLFLINRWSVIRYITQKFDIFKNLQVRIYIHLSMVYRSKFEASRNRS